jgi:hypothetical protein
MTVCATVRAIEVAAGNGDGTPQPGCVITADGTYAARLALVGGSWFPERWTLDGPEPYAVPLPGNQPEEPGTEVLPMRDGRVLIHRAEGGRHMFSLLYPAGPGTGELPLGVVECPDRSDRVRLLPPAPDGECAYALAVGRSSTVWLVAGGAFGPERLAELPGRCSGGVWLDGAGRLLALDRSLDGPAKTVVVDLERGGEMSPLLQIAADSEDRLLLADPDSGLLLIRSDAPSPGQGRLGWGVLGSTLPVRFPRCLRLGNCVVTPFAIQPGQALTPESCAVALRVDGTVGSWVGVWRPTERQIHHFPSPEGWLAGAGVWSREGVLRLPYVARGVPCGVVRVERPWEVGVEPSPGVSTGTGGATETGSSTGAGAGTGTAVDTGGGTGARAGNGAGAALALTAPTSVSAPGEGPESRAAPGNTPPREPVPPPGRAESAAARPVPLREAPLGGRAGSAPLPSPRFPASLKQVGEPRDPRHPPGTASPDPGRRLAGPGPQTPVVRPPR